MTLEAEAVLKCCLLRSVTLNSHAASAGSLDTDVPLLIHGAEWTGENTEAALDGLSVQIHFVV